MNSHLLESRIKCQRADRPPHNTIERPAMGNWTHSRGWRFRHKTFCRNDLHDLKVLLALPLNGREQMLPRRFLARPPSAPKFFPQRLSRPPRSSARNHAVQSQSVMYKEVAPWEPRRRPSRQTSAVDPLPRSRFQRFLARSPCNSLGLNYIQGCRGKWPNEPFFRLVGCSVPLLVAADIATGS